MLAQVSPHTSPDLSVSPSGNQAVRLAVTGSGVDRQVQAVRHGSFDGRAPRRRQAPPETTRTCRRATAALGGKQSFPVGSVLRRHARSSHWSTPMSSWTASPGTAFSLAQKRWLRGMVCGTLLLPFQQDVRQSFRQKLTRCGRAVHRQQGSALHPPFRAALDQVPAVHHHAVNAVATR